MYTARARFLLAGLLIIGSAAFGARQTSATLVLTVRLYNYAALTTPELNIAEHEAGAILRHAGINVEWIECGVSPVEAAKSERCDKVIWSVVISLLPESMEARLPHPARAYAVAIPSVVFVFCERIHRAAEQSGVTRGRMLGVTLAHELGHELLGASSHSANGIMKPTLEAADFALAERGRLTFTEADVIRLRAVLQNGTLH